MIWSRLLYNNTWLQPAFDASLHLIFNPKQLWNNFYRILRLEEKIERLFGLGYLKKQYKEIFSAGQLEKEKNYSSPSFKPTFYSEVLPRDTWDFAEMVHCHSHPQVFWGSKNKAQYHTEIS